MSYFSTTSSGTGGGPFSSITGTPTEVAYFDALGNGTSDDGFTRNPTTLETTIYSPLNGFTGGYIATNTFFGGLTGYGIAIEEDSGDSGAFDMFLAVPTGTGSEDLPDGLTKFESYTSLGGDLTIFKSGSGMGSEFDSLITDNRASESLTGELFQKTYYNTDYSEGSMFVMSPSKTSLGRGTSQSTNSTTQYQETATVYNADGVNSRIYTQERADRVETYSKTVSSVDFTGTGLDDIILGGGYESSNDGTYTIEVKGAGNRLFFPAMDSGQFPPGATITGSDSGATGVVVLGQTNSVYVVSVTGTFNTNDILSDTDGNISEQVTSIQSGVIYQSDYRIAGVTEILNSNIGFISTTPGVLRQGELVSWAGTTGHDTGDVWVVTMTNVWATRQITPAKSFTVPVGGSVDIFEVDLPGNTMASGFVEWTVNATDGTDFQTRTTRRAWSAVNKAGSITADIGSATTGASVSAGTLVTGLNYNTTIGKVQFNVDATSSLTTTSMEAQVFITNNSKQSITIPY